MSKKTTPKIFLILILSAFFSFQAFADDGPLGEDPEEGPEAPPAPISDWVPVLFISGVVLVSYVFYKRKPELPTK